MVLVVVFICKEYYLACFFALLFAWNFTIEYATGAATKIDDKVPNTTPRIIANEKLRTLSPPRMKIHNSTINVLNDVFNVRARVVFNEALNNSYLLRFG